MSLGDLRLPPGESSAKVAQRVLTAREVQRTRFPNDHPTPVNAALGPEAVQEVCTPDSQGQRLLERAFDALGLSARAHNRILKVARTLADLDGATTILASHIAEAVQYRALDRRGEG